jgi:hypothetical protein
MKKENNNSNDTQGTSFNKEVKDKLNLEGGSSMLQTHNTQGQSRPKEEDDGLSLEDHRISQDFGNRIGVKKAIISVPVRKPGKQDFIRVHPDKEMSFETCALKVDEDNEFYVLNPALFSEVMDHVFPVVLFTTVNRSGDLTLWPVKLPGPDGKPNSWNQSALEAAEMAKSKWIRLISNRSLGAYEPYIANSDIQDPEWPDMDFQTIFRIAFKKHYIRNQDHPVLKGLRGE